MSAPATAPPPLLGIGIGIISAAALADLLGISGSGLGPIELFGVTIGGIALAARAWWRTPTLRISTAIVVGLWFGLVVALVEIPHRWLVTRSAGLLAAAPPPHYVWVAPLTYAVLFVAVGATLAAVARRRIAWVTLPVLVFLCAFTGTFAQCTAHRAFHPWAWLALSFGIAATAGRLVAARPAAFVTLVRRSSPWLAAVLAVIAFAVLESAPGREPPSSALPVQLPDGAVPRNVLLIVLDTVRADHLGTYGYARSTTPHIDRLAAGATVFENAIAPASWTLPTHASLFTGHYPQDLSASWLTPLDERRATLAESLAARGYQTAGFVGNVSFCQRATGLARGFDHYEDFYVRPLDAVTCNYLASWFFGSAVRPWGPTRNDATTVASAFLQWYAARDARRPYFAFLNFFDAHGPQYAPAGWRHKFGERIPLLAKWNEQVEVTAAEFPLFIDAYDACLAFIDDQIGRIIEGLRHDGTLDDTLLIIVGDHGEQFGEHGFRDHGNTLYRQLLHVPLIMAGAGAPAARRVSGVVSLRDLAATICAMVGVTQGVLPGTSLAPMWRDTPAGAVGSPVLSFLRKGVRPRPVQPNARGDMYSLLSGHHHLIINGNGSEELYDLRSDPHELQNLLERADSAALAGQMRSLLERALAGNN